MVLVSFFECHCTERGHRNNGRRVGVDQFKRQCPKPIGVLSWKTMFKLNIPAIDAGPMN
jgi:hypothetical protein